ncbi:hypothetical protein OUZ56_033732, partial [Daphnia magna]
MSRTQSDRKQFRSPPLGGSVFDRQSKRICFREQMKTVFGIPGSGFHLGTSPKDCPVPKNSLSS